MLVRRSQTTADSSQGLVDQGERVTIFPTEGIQHSEVDTESQTSIRLLNEENGGSIWCLGRLNEAFRQVVGDIFFDYFKFLGAHLVKRGVLESFLTIPLPEQSCGRTIGEIRVYSHLFDRISINMNPNSQYCTYCTVL